MNIDHLTSYLRFTRWECDQAIVQVPDAKLYEKPHPSCNSVGVLIQHMAGNLVSRWSYFLEQDGEKVDRDRDGEFTPKNLERGELLCEWDYGWLRLNKTLEKLKPEDYEKTVYIRARPYSVLKAITETLWHMAHHGGQLIWAAKIVVGDSWKTLSIPDGGSEAFNREVWGTEGPEANRFKGVSA